jgi:hypothetical protein
VVKRGQVVALSGDSGETCYGRPHLHLEFRDLAHITKYNPITLIEANWDNLVLLGDTARDFARDLDEPRKWQSLYDQPQARTAGPIINDFANPWPLDWEKGVTSPAESALEMTTLFTETEIVPIEPLHRLPVARQLTAGDCCTQFYWAADSSEIRYIDQPSRNAPLGLWGIDPLQPRTGPQFVTAQLGIYSPDGKWFAYPDRESGQVVIERLATGKQRLLDTKGRSPSFTPDSQSVMWTDYDEDAPRDTREETIWLADVDGGQPRSLISARRVSRVAWLSNDLWLMSRRIAGSSDQELFTFSLVDGSQETLIQQLPRFRSVALSPNKRYMVYYVAFESAAENGVWLYDLKFPKRAPRKLPFFGTYRWQDDDHLIYVPLEPEATEHNFYQYDLLTRQTRPLFPTGTGLIIANNEWRISPDGRQLALLAADGQKLDGIWVLDLAQNPES